MWFHAASHVQRRVARLWPLCLQGCLPRSKQVADVPNDGTLKQLLCFWTLSIALFWIEAHSASETWILSPSSGGTYSWTQPIEQVSMSGDRRSLRNVVGLNKSRAMDNAQKRNICIVT
jgi:hypothetical protein